MPFENKEQAIEAFERSRGEYLAAARLLARRIAIARESRAVTVDDIREQLPPPRDADPRIMGAIFATREWQPGRFVNSRRRACHGRPIREFVLKE